MNARDDNWAEDDAPRIFRGMTASDPRTEGAVDVRIRDAVATVEFGHPKSNSLPSALLRKLADEIRKAGETRGVNVIVLRSQGTGAFCAGASFDEMKAVHDAESGRAFFTGFALVIQAMIRAPQFVVTRVHGKATGGAVGLIAASDYAMAVRGASFKLSELAVGLGPFVIGPVVERKVGRGPFAALSIDADWRDADWGERHGLYSRLFDDVPALDAALDTLVAFLAAANPDAIRQLKSVLWDDVKHWETLLEERAAISGTLALSDYTQNAIKAFARR